MMTHTSPLIHFRKVRRGAGKGQIVTYCLDASHEAGSEGQLIGIDIMPALASMRADQHLAGHERDKALTL
jgi:hypothetical protein